MQLRNKPYDFGLVSMLLHWLMAILIIGLFFLGKYIVDLDYYNPWYIKAPELHLGLGVIVALLLAIRMGWRLSNPLPQITGKPWEKYAALWVHRAFYIMIAGIVISGYFTTTAEGTGLSVFSWFDIPASFYGHPNQEDIAGMVHEWLANLMIALVVIHSLAALKHHFINRDSTLCRMLVLEESYSISSTITKPGNKSL